MTGAKVTSIERMEEIKARILSNIAQLEKNS
jgi:hypothetical protein